MDELNLEEQTKKNVENWLSADYGEQTQQEVRRLAQENPKELSDAFYTTLEFGTGGLRGLMGIGSNRINLYTVQFATQGLANYLKKSASSASANFVPAKVAISFDSRHQSQLFAQEAAKVLIGNGLEVYLFPELRPTPLLSFACRYKQCQAAIMITASHNPATYNGYKVYGDDGAQVVAPHDAGIIAEVKKVVSPKQVSLGSLSSPLLHMLDRSIDAAYLEAVKKLQLYPQECQKAGSNLKVVYSNLHGTGITLLPQLLKSYGLTQVSLVAEQSEPDGSFPTVISPNPEEKAALKLGIEQLKREGADLLIATDPDADRVAAVVMHQGEAMALDGNQMACLLLDHVLNGLKEKKRLPQNGAVVKSLVTTELYQKIAKSYQIPCFDVLTGFKYIAEKMRNWEKDQSTSFLFGAEESYGYLFGTEARDKDALLAAALIAEMAALAKEKGQTLIDLLNGIYRRHGVFRERLMSLNFPETKEGRALMQDAMQRLRQAPPSHLGESPIAFIEDYQLRVKKDLASGATETLQLPPSDVLVLWTKEGYKVVVRPSGTEPKVKVYFGAMEEGASLEEGVSRCDLLLDQLQRAVKDFFKL